MTHLLTLLASLMGFAALALGMARHQMEVLGRLLPREAGRALSLAGAVWLAVAWGLAWEAWGAGLGSVGFSAHTMLAAGLVHGGLSLWRGRAMTGR